MPDYRNTPERLPAWWHEPWCQLLVASYDEVGPGRTGELLGVSASMVTGVARGYYESSIDRIRTASIEVLEAASVECPVLGEIKLATCRQHREADFAASNPLRARLWRACRTCPNNPDS